MTTVDQRSQQTETSSTAGSSSNRPSAGKAATQSVRWGLVTVVASLLGALIPLLTNPRFYFYDDTEAGAYGIWFEIGKQLRAGQWPLFSDNGWAAGNYAAEGQWGIWNPLIMAVGLLASVATSAVVFTTILKIVLLMILAGGTFLLARHYGASPAWAAVGGVATPLAGFTVYMDAPSWVTGLMVFALLPWTWWGLRRTIFGRRNPVFGLVFGYLLITIGYVHGTIMLVAVFLGLLVEIFMRRRRDGALSLLFCGVILGLVAVTVYLPGVLTASVTVRGTGIGNSGFLGTDLTGLASSAMGSSLPQINGWWGAFSPVPILYIAWFLPLAALISGRKVGAAWRELSAILVVGIISLMLTLAPSDMGPLRFPVRLMPYVALTVIVLVCVMISRFGVETFSKARTATILAIFSAGAYLAWSQNPKIVRIHFIFAALALVGILAVVAILYGRSRLHGWDRLRVFRPEPVAAVVMILVSLATAGGQRHYFPAAPLPDFGFPDAKAAYEKPLTGSQGMAFIVGEPNKLGPDIWKETLASNAWYLSDAQVQNLYSPIMFAKYSDDLCMTSHGWTCPAAADKLFSIDPATGKRIVDLIAVDTVQILRDPGDAGGVALHQRRVPKGWHEIASTPNAITWVRDAPLRDTGEPVWTSGGTRVSTVSDSSQQLVFRVDQVGSNGGQVALSRLAWPGYKADGATLADPLRGYLLTVNIPANSLGKDIVVSFEPPAWNVLVSLIILAGLLGAAWSGVAVKRNRSMTSTAAEIRSGDSDE